MLGDLVVTAGARADRWSVTGGNFTSQDGSGALVSAQRFADQSGWQASLQGRRVVARGRRRFRCARLPTPGCASPRSTNYTALSWCSRSRRAPMLNLATSGSKASRRGSSMPAARLFTSRSPRSTTASNTRLPMSRSARTCASARTSMPFGRAGSRRRRGYAKAHGRSTRRWRGPMPRSRAAALRRRSTASGPRRCRSLPQAPPRRGSPTMAGGWRRRCGMLGRQFEDDLETDALPAATTLDAFAEVPLGKHAGSRAARREPDGRARRHPQPRRFDRSRHAANAVDRPQIARRELSS